MAADRSGEFMLAVWDWDPNARLVHGPLGPRVVVLWSDPDRTTDLYPVYVYTCAGQPDLHRCPDLQLLDPEGSSDA